MEQKSKWLRNLQIHFTEDAFNYKAKESSKAFFVPFILMFILETIVLSNLLKITHYSDIGSNFVALQAFVEENLFLALLYAAGEILTKVIIICMIMRRLNDQKINRWWALLYIAPLAKYVVMYLGLRPNSSPNAPDIGSYY